FSVTRRLPPTSPLFPYTTLFRSSFPQTQTANGSYRRIAAAGNFFDQWNFNFNLVWELDFWGRFRRAIAAAEASLDASVFDYDAEIGRASCRERVCVRVGGGA